MSFKNELMVFLCGTLLSAVSLHSQEAGSEANPPAAETPAASTAAPAPPPTKAPANTQQLLESMLKEETAAKARIKEIEAIVFPIQDEIAQKQFFFSPGEYAFLRMQSETASSTAKFFEAQRRIDQDSWEGVADAFDIAYEAIRQGQLWVGREQSLVAEDAALYSDLKSKVTAAIQQRPDGKKIMALIEERDQLLNRTKASGPMLKYLSERRQWWERYPEYMQTVRDQATNKP
jgi:hypothetical protein